MIKRQLFKSTLLFAAVMSLGLASSVVGLDGTFALQKNVKKQQARIDGTKVLAWTEIFQRSKNAVVQIFTYTNDYNVLEPYKSPEQGQCRGTGFIISSDGYILTNFHVVNQAVALFVQLPEFGREQFDVEYVGATPSYDIALLKFSDKSLQDITERLASKELPYLTLGDSDKVTEAQRVMAIGYPLGEQNIKIAVGEIAGREATPVGECMQTTAPINGGNSGGPFFNEYGQVIGICVMKAVAKDIEGVAYVIPIDRAKTILEELFKARIVHSPYWGLSISPTTEDTLRFLQCPVEGGIYVEKVYKGSLAEKATLKESDIVYQVNGYDVDRYGYINAPWRDNDKVRITDVLTRIPFGDNVVFSVYRNGKPLKLSVAVKNESPFAINYVYPWFDQLPDYEVIGGIVAMDLTLNHLVALGQYPQYYDLSELMKYTKEENRFKKRVIISEVIPNSPLYKTRAIQPGSIIDQVNGIKVDTMDDFRAAIVQTIGSDITLKTEDGAFVVLPVEDIMAEEPVLSKRYCYELSSLFYKILQK